MGVDFGNLTDVAHTRQELRVVAGEAAFAWLRPIVETTLADFVRGVLGADPPDEDRYSAYAIDENVSVATDMVNRCLSRRSQIYDLESAALRTAIGYQQELRLAESDARLARVQAQAHLAAAGQSLSPDIERVLAQQAEVRAGTLRARIELHNLAGSSVNFGEQVAFMRAVYADNIRNLAERIEAIRRGVTLCYGVGPGVLPDLPRAEEQGDDLDLIVWWLRGVVKTVEWLERTAMSFRVYLPLFRMQSLAAPAALEAWNSFLESGYAEGELDEGVLLRHGLASSGNAPIRIVGVGVAMLLGRPQYQDTGEDAGALRANTEMQNRLTACRAFGFPCTLTAPESAEMWDAPTPLHVGVLHVSANEPATAQLQPGDPGLLRNRSPLGTWAVQVGPHAVQGTWHPSPAVVSLQEVLRQFPPGSVDVVLCLELCIGPAMLPR